MNRQLAVLTLIIATLITACSKQPNPAPDISSAIRTLKKMEAATQVGTRLDEYRQLVIDAKVQVDEASAKLPDGELKRELNATFAAYSDAYEVWNAAKNGDKSQYYPFHEKDKPLFTEYSLRNDTSNIFNPVMSDEVRQAIWVVARKRLERTVEALERERKQ